LVAAYDQSGLSRQDYLARIGAPAEAIQVVLDDALAEVDQQRARRTALLKAYEASGKTPEEFADMLGMDVRNVKAALRAVPIKHPAVPDAQATPDANPA
jgi:hypothetical protein